MFRGHEDGAVRVDGPAAAVAVVVADTRDRPLAAGVETDDVERHGAAETEVLRHRGRRSERLEAHLVLGHDVHVPGGVDRSAVLDQGLAVDIDHVERDRSGDPRASV